MNNAAHGKTMENLRNRIVIRLLSYEIYYLRWTTKSSYISQKIFDSGIVAMRKSKVIFNA